MTLEVSLQLHLKEKMGQRLTGQGLSGQGTQLGQEEELYKYRRG